MKLTIPPATTSIFEGVGAFGHCIAISFSVRGMEPVGQPRPRQGKIRFGRRAGEKIFYTPEVVAAWKTALVFAARRARSGPTPSVAVAEVHLVFFFTRPKSHFLKSGAIKPAALGLPYARKPDIDNLEKPVLDVLTATGHWKDDAVVDELHSRRRWAASPEAAGVDILLRLGLA